MSDPIDDEDDVRVDLYFCADRHLHIDVTDDEGEVEYSVSLEIEQGSELLFSAVEQFCEMAGQNFLLLTNEELAYVRSLLNREDGFEDTIGPTVGTA